MLAGLQDPFGGLHDTDEILAVARVAGHWNGHPYMMLKKVLSPYKLSDPYRPSASIIAGGSWRRSVLERLLDYYPKMDNIYPMLRGTLVHAGLEAFDAPGVEKEIFLRAAIPDQGAILTGKADLYVPEFERLIDWKTSSKPPNYIKPAHIFQLAIYAWLLRWTGRPVSQVAISYVAWRQAKYVSITKDGKPACEHRLMTRQDYFIEQLMDGYHILELGFKNLRLPSTSECIIKWCPFCPVKWACYQLPMDGDDIGIVPDFWDQHDYAISYGGRE